MSENESKESYDVCKDFEVLRKLVTEEEFDISSVLRFLSNQVTESCNSKDIYLNTFINVMSKRPPPPPPPPPGREQLQQPCSRKVSDGMSALLSVNCCTGLFYQWTRDGKNQAIIPIFQVLIKMCC